MRDEKNGALLLQERVMKIILGLTEDVGCMGFNVVFRVQVSPFSAEQWFEI